MKEVAAEIYPAIEETTDYLVEFNDLFDKLEQGDESAEKALLGDLTRLGEIIAIRTELEDQILTALQR